MDFPTLATNFEHEVLGNEYCSGYSDLFNKWNTGFYCPQTGTGSSSLAVYCCGTPVYKYCCTVKPSQSPLDDVGDKYGNDASFILSDTPVIIAIACGIIAVLILVIVSSCFFCSCCFVHKKRSHNVPGMYRMEESSTTQSFHPNNQSLQSLRQNQSHSQTTIVEEPRNNHHPHAIGNQIVTQPRPIISIQPQQMTIGNPNFGQSLQNLGPINAGQQNWAQHELGMEPHQHQNQAIFHINATSHSVPGIRHNNNQGSPYLPARFASNQNLTTYGNGGVGTIIGRGPSPIILGASNPREIQKYYEYGLPYTLSLSGPQEYQQQLEQYRLREGGPIYQNQNSNNEEFYNSSNKFGNVGYCTSTLPSCLRRSGSGTSSTIGVQRGGQPLKSILRNPLPNYSYSNNPTTSVQSSVSAENSTPIRSFTPMSITSSGGARVPNVGDFDFCEPLLPQVPLGDSISGGSGSDEHSYTSYNFPNYSPDRGNGTGESRPFSPDLNPGSSSRERRFSTSTEYQNDINRLGKDLDPESLTRLIELDLESKL